MRRLLIFLLCIPALCFSQNSYRATRVVQNPNVADCAGYCFRGHLPVPATGETYCAEATALFAKITDWGVLTPSEIETRKGHINTLIIELKDAGIWETRDRIWVGAMPSEQASMIEWKGTNDNLVKVNNPTFQPDSGWASDGVSGYYSTTYIPSNGPNYTLNDAGIEIYFLTYHSQTGGFPAGVYMYRTPENTFSGALIYGYVADYNAPSVLINSTNAMNGTGWISASIGMFSGNRTSSSACSMYVNGVLNANVSSSSIYVPDQPIYICAYHFSVLGSSQAAGFDDRRLSLVMYGSSLTPAQDASLSTVFEKYMDALGTGVNP